MSYISHNDKQSIRVKLSDYTILKLDRGVKRNITTRSVALECLIDLYFNDELPDELLDMIEQRRDEFLKHLEDKKRRE